MFNLFTTPTTITTTKKKLISAKTFQIICSEVLSLPHLDLIHAIVLEREKIKNNNFSIGSNAEGKTLYTYMEILYRNKVFQTHSFRLLNQISQLLFESY